MSMARSSILNSLEYSSRLWGGPQPPLPLLYLTSSIRREGQPTTGPEQGSPDTLGEGLDEVRVEEADGPDHWLVDPLIILLSQVAYLPQ